MTSKQKGERGLEIHLMYKQTHFAHGERGEGGPKILKSYKDVICGIAHTDPNCSLSLYLLPSPSVSLSFNVRFAASERKKERANEGG